MKGFCIAIKFPELEVSFIGVHLELYQTASLLTT